MGSDAERELEEARERQYWGRVVRGVSASLVLLGAVALLWILTALLDWQRHLLLSFIGLLSGVAVATAFGGSARERAITGLVIGGVTLPVLAAYLAGTAARSPDTFGTSSAGLFAFFVHGTVACAGVLWIAALRRRARSGGPPPTEPRGDLGAGEGATP
jgi:hypothetical protein